MRNCVHHHQIAVAATAVAMTFFLCRRCRETWKSSSTTTTIWKTTQQHFKHNSNNNICNWNRNRNQTQHKTQRDNIKTIQQSKHLSRIRSVCQTPFVITVVVSRFVLIGRIAWVSEILLVCFTLDLYKQFRFSVAVSVFRAFSFRFYSVCQMKIQSRNPKKGSC